MEQKKLSKKLPKRTSRPQHKVYRAVCWARQEKRKDARRKAQGERHALNVIRWAQGDKTPWEIAKAERYARRHAE